MTVLRVDGPAYLLGLTFLAACGGDDTDPSDGPRVALELEVTNILSDEPEPDAEVCQIRPTMDGCVTSDADGRATLMVPAMDDVAIRYDKPGFWPLVHMVTTEGVDHAIEADIANDLAVSVAASGAMMMPEPGKGQLLVQLAEPDGENVDLDGFMVQLDGPGDHPPVYFGNDQTPDPALTETTDLGLTAFINLDPGEYEVSVDHPSISCATTESGWLTGEATRVGALAVADALTTVAFLDCR